jgi:hypothetical protein
MWREGLVAGAGEGGEATLCGSLGGPLFGALNSAILILPLEHLIQWFAEHLSDAEGGFERG